MIRTPLGTVSPLATVCGQPRPFTQEYRSFNQRLVSAGGTDYLSLWKCTDDPIPRPWREDIASTGADRPAPAPCCSEFGAHSPLPASLGLTKGGTHLGSCRLAEAPIQVLVNEHGATFILGTSADQVSHENMLAFALDGTARLSRYIGDLGFRPDQVAAFPHEWISRGGRRWIEDVWMDEDSGEFVVHAHGTCCLRSLPSTARSATVVRITWRDISLASTVSRRWNPSD